MANSRTVYCYFWIKVVDAAGQMKDDAAALSGTSKAASASLATVDSPVTIWAMPQLSLATVDSPVTIWSAPADNLTTVTINAVENAAVAKDPTKTELTTSCITLNQSYDSEDKARKWIDSDKGKAWRGNASICVLHRIAVKFDTK